MNQKNTPFRCYLCDSDQVKYSMPYRAYETDSIFKNSYVVECKNCGLLQINKKFSAAVIEQYYKSVYDREDIYSFNLNLFPADNTWSVSRGRALAKLAKRYNVIKTPKPTIMDLGCGYGHLLYGFNEYLNIDCGIIGVDYEPKTKSVFDKFTWRFELGGIDDVYQNYTEKVDILITSHVFEHVIDPHDFLDKCRSVLSGEGVLLWEVPNLNEYNLMCEARHSPHICLWDIFSLRKILENKNFEIVFLETAGKKYTWFDIKKPMNRVLNKFYKKLKQGSDVAFDLSNRESIGYQLDEYGSNRRNLRLIAQKKT